jgi:ABC-type transport system substrate-binding protein
MLTYAVAVYIGGGYDTQMPYIPLTRYNGSGAVVPDITKVAFVPGTNDTQVIYNLVAPDLKWSDGVPINASDLYFSFDQYLPQGTYANTTTDILNRVAKYGTGVSIFNSTAVKVTLNAPLPHVDILFALYPVYPEHYYKTFGVGNHILDKTPVLGGPGDTPYVPSNYTAGSTTMTLKANPYSPWWNGKAITVPLITVQLFASESALVNALAAGSVDAALVNPNDVAALQSTPNLHIVNTIGLWGPFFRINAAQGYPFNNTDFRQGLMYLLPKQQINTILYNNQGLIGNAMEINPQAVSFYWPGPSTPTYDYSTVNAIASFQKAGLKQNGQGQWVTPSGQVVTISLETETDDPNFIRAAQFIQTAMQGVGLSVTVKQVNGNTVISDWATKNFQTVLMPWSATTPWEVVKSAINFPGLVNDTFFSAFTTAFTDTNVTRGLQEFKKVDLMMAQLAMDNVILLYPQIIAYNSARFTGWEPAIEQTANSNLIATPVFASNVLTSIQPIAAGTSSTTTSATTATSTTPSTSTTTATSISTTTAVSTTTSVSTTTATTTATTPAAVDYTIPILGLIAVIAIVGIIAVAALRRRQPRTVT